MIELGLSQARQREVGRGHAAMLRINAVRHQRLQVPLKCRRQRFNHGFVEALLTEAQVQFEFAAKHLTVHRQPVGQR